jgi:hypothetical protein
MNCQRCLRAEEARYRAYSDIIDMKVCAACAADGRKLGLSIEVLDPLRSPLAQLTLPQRYSTHLVG